jgi:hypothetical protein
MHDSASKQLEEARLASEQQWARLKAAWEAAPKDNRSMAQKQWDTAQVRLDNWEIHDLHRLLPKGMYNVPLYGHCVD